MSLNPVIAADLSFVDLRFAVVAIPGSISASHRFEELLAAERLGGAFALFSSRDGAVEWLRTS
jgi:hypothetical protein